MSLASPYLEHYYVADGVTTTFSFGTHFTGISQTFVKCIIYFSNNTSCLPVYTVDMATGYITIVSLTTPEGTVLTIPPAGSIVRVFRNTPKAQDMTASQIQAYTAKQLEITFDQIVAMIQEVGYSDQHKTVRLTETQRDVSLQKLDQAQNGSLIYWVYADSQLKATNYKFDEVLLSDTIRRIEKDNSGYIYFDNQRIGVGVVHNDLMGRGVSNCHPIAAITGLQDALDDLDEGVSGKQPLLTSANAGDGISITGSGANVLISNTNLSAEWGNIQGDITDQNDLMQKFATKQNNLTAGDGIKIQNDEISTESLMILDWTGEDDE